MITADALIGIWHLHAVTMTDASGCTHHPFGRHPHGSILYLPSGTMAVHIAGSDDSAGRLRIYAGRWSLRHAWVIHDVDISHEPELVGQRLERLALLDGHVLTYKTAENQGAGRPSVIWSRMPAAGAPPIDAAGRTATR